MDPLLSQRGVDESTVANVNSHMSRRGGLTSLEENQISDLQCLASDFVTDLKLFSGGTGLIDAKEAENLLDKSRAIHPMGGASTTTVLQSQEATRHADQMLPVFLIQYESFVSDRVSGQFRRFQWILRPYFARSRLGGLPDGRVDLSLGRRSG